MSVKKIVIVTAIVLFFYVGAPVECLQCQFGQKVKVGILTPFNNLNSTNCLTGSSCLYVEHVIKAKPFSGKIISGGCIESTSCQPGTCARAINSINKLVKRYVSNAVIPLDSCTWRCCNTDNCNHASGLRFRSGMIFIFSLLAFFFLSLFTF